MLLRELERELQRWDDWMDPFKEFKRLNLGLVRSVYPKREEFPPVNMWKDEGKVVISTEVPGIDPAGFDISVTGAELTIKFERKSEQLKEGETYTKKERWHGRFSRTIELPFNVQTDRVEAKYNRGVLIIELPRAEAEKPKKITLTPE